MFLVKFRATYKIGKDTKVSFFEETHTSEANARLRALALNWEILAILPQGGVQ